MKLSGWACGVLFVLGGILLSGCTVWPTMTETETRRPVAMGKDDQVFYWEARRPTVLSKTFGKTFQMMKEDQTLNPEASENLEPPTGQDGQAGVLNMGRYRGYFKKPPYGGVVSTSGKK